MSVVVAVTDGKSVVMGSDSILLTNDGLKIHCKDEKLIKLKDMLIGVVGDLRIANVLRYKFKPSTQAKPDVEYMNTTFLDEYTKLLSDNNIEVDEESSILVGLGGKIFEISCGNVFQHVLPYHAIGMGEASAMGACYVMYTLGYKPENTVRHALMASIEHCTGTSGQIYLIRS